MALRSDQRTSVPNNPGSSPDLLSFILQDIYRGAKAEALRANLLPALP